MNRQWVNAIREDERNRLAEEVEKLKRKHNDWCNLEDMEGIKEEGCDCGVFQHNQSIDECLKIINKE